jgi:FKBP-type peptidyl-prolyl cis-trans isomerase FkpA
MTSKISILIVVMMLFTACNSSGPKKVSISTEEDKVFYTLGVHLGQRLAMLNLEDKELAALYQGFYDSAKNKELAVKIDDYQMKVQDMFKEKMSKIGEANKKKGDEFLATFLKEAGAQKTASGLAYKVTQEGTGKMPKSTDVVEVHYHGTLIDGTVFDSSVERGKPVSFPLNRVIRGWTEGMQLVKEGGKVKLVIPPDLGYGENGAPPKIPGGATLVFEIELLKIKEGEDKAEAPAIKPVKKADKKGK